MVKNLKIFFLTVLTAFMATTVVSCEDLYEHEGDCTSKYRIRFVYSMNLKWADAFASEVKSVDLYMFDADGLFVRSFAAAGDELSKPDFCIEFDDETVEPGKYTFVAWCGLVNNGVAMESFTVPRPVEGVTTIDELTCSLNTLSSRLDEEAYEYSDSRLYFMYHGMLEATLPDTHRGYTYDYTINLTKDTNHIRILLHELSGEEMDPDNYEFVIEAADGRLAYDNSILPGCPTVFYTPWDTNLDSMQTTSDAGVTTTTHGVVVDLSTSRMMANMQDKFVLTVYDKNSNEKIIARVPLIQYALLSKDYYNMAYGHNMDNQEFLDREDEYMMTFFLFKNRWIDSYIYVNSWRIVLHDYELNN